jgi:hypothetical protein
VKIVKPQLSIEDVEQAFQSSMEKMIEAIDNFPWESETAYAHWLGQTYYLVRHTTRFLTLSAGHMSIQQDTFHQFFLHHLRDESGHEMLAYKDLESLSWNIGKVPETLEAQLMLQCQYYWLNETPFAHFGFFWCLEKLSVERGRAAMARIAKAHGPQCMSFLELHSDEDIGHVKSIHERVKAIPSEHYPVLVQNIEQTVYLYSNMLQKIAVLAEVKVPVLPATRKAA